MVNKMTLLWKQPTFFLCLQPKLLAYLSLRYLGYKEKKSVGCFQFLHPKLLVLEFWLTFLNTDLLSKQIVINFKDKKQHLEFHHHKKQDKELLGYLPS